MSKRTTYDLRTLSIIVPIPYASLLEEARSKEWDLRCSHCREICRETDQDGHAPLNVDGDNGLVHKACFIRMIVGSLGHQMHRCSCYGGSMGDPTGLTTRQAAVAAYRYYLRRNTFNV